MKIRIDGELYQVTKVEFVRADESYNYFVEGQDEPYNDNDCFIEIVEREDF